jgi:hypothetical protein
MRPYWQRYFCEPLKPNKQAKIAWNESEKKPDMSPKLKDNLKCIGGLCAVGLTFIVVCALMIGDLTESGKSKVDGHIPGVFPVVVRVEDKAQIVWGDDLNQYLEEHPNYSLLIPENQTKKFQSQINSNIRGAQSPPSFDTRSDLPWDAFFTVQTIAPGKQAFKVYATWDDDRMNVGWYKATDKEIFPLYHTLYFGPGLACTHVPIAAMITAALCLIASRLIHYLRRRFSHSEEHLT